MNVSRLREETSILKNIKQREIIEMKKKENQVRGTIQGDHSPWRKPPVDIDLKVAL